VIDNEIFCLLSNNIPAGNENKSVHMLTVKV